MKRERKIVLIVIALPLVVALGLLIAHSCARASINQNRDALMQLREKEKNCYYYSEELNAYFIASIGHCGQIIIDGVAQDIFYGDSMPYSDDAAIEPIDGPVYFNDGYYDSVIYGTHSEDWIIWGSVKYTSDGIELKIEDSSVLNKADYPKKIMFNLYPKENIDLFEKGFTRVYDYDYETEVVTIKGIDGAVESFERGTSIRR